MTVVSGTQELDTGSYFCPAGQLRGGPLGSEICLIDSGSRSPSILITALSSSIDAVPGRTPHLIQNPILSPGYISPMLGCSGWLSGISKKFIGGATPS